VGKRKLSATFHRSSNYVRHLPTLNEKNRVATKTERAKNMKILSIKELCNLSENRFKAYCKKINGVKHNLSSDNEYLVKKMLK